MDTIMRMKELAAERNITVFRLAQICGVPYSTLKNTEQRGGQLAVSTIEQICEGLGIPLYMYFYKEGDEMKK